MKKYIAITGITTLLVTGAMIVLAQESSVPATANANAAVSAATPQPMVVQIGPGGRTLLRGTVSVVGTNSLTVKSWGGDWVINISATTKLMPGSDMSQFAVGDFVGAQGITSASALWTVDATLVRNWTVRKTIQEDRKEVRELIKSITARNWQGIASNVNIDAKTLTLTIEGTAYSVVLAPGAKVVNVNFTAMDFSMINNGDIVRAYGPATDTTITASVLRDVSVK